MKNAPRVARAIGPVRCWNKSATGGPPTALAVPNNVDANPDAKAVNRFVGIGESGLDYYYDHSDRGRQRDSFRSHVAAARETRLPLIVHTRDAEADTYEILAEEMAKGDYPALIHCFTASRDFADKVLALGLYVSISGIVTFKNARELQDVAKGIPRDRLLIETDSPFLAPVPHRGRPCEPAYVADTARFLAALRGEPVATLAEATSANFHRLFAKAAA